MIGVRTAVDANEPVTRVYVRPLVLWILAAFCGMTLFVVGGAALAEMGANDDRVAPGFWWFGGPFTAFGLIGAAIVVAERLDPTPAVEIRPDRFTLRQPLLIWTRGREIKTAEVERLWAVGTGERTALGGEEGLDRLCVRLRSGKLVRYETMNLAVSGVELERLIREATGLDVPGRPPAPARSPAVRWLRSAVGADPDGP